MLRKLLIIIASILIIFFAYQFAKNKGWISNQVSSKIDSILPSNISLPWNNKEEIDLTQIKISQEDLEKFGSEGIEQIKILTGKAKEAGGVAQEFVQEAVKVDENSKQNISEKAFEYGKYIYCQEVVKQYEASHSSETTF